MRGDVSWFCELDYKLRIKRVPSHLKVDPGFGVGGHSVCNRCLKDMPVCWDVVCFQCNKTFCYDHAKVVNGLWYCLSCESRCAGAHS